MTQRFLFSIWIFLNVFSALKAQNATPLCLGETLTYSSTVLQEQRIIHVWHPPIKPDNDTTHYQVLWVLDGSMHEDFIHTVGVVQFFNLMFQMPPTLVVGISNVDRKRDFTFPTQIKELREATPTSGGSARFMDFLEQELLPDIKARYRTNGVHMLSGQSLGGLLAAQILLRRPTMFSHYFITSPSMWWDDSSLQTEAPALALQLPNQPLYAHIAVGQEGRIMKKGAKKLYKALKNAHKPQLITHFTFLPKENHATILHQSLYSMLLQMYPYQP